MEILFILLMSFCVTGSIASFIFGFLEQEWKMVFPFAAFVVTAMFIGSFGISWGYDNPTIEQAPYKINSYYADSYELKEGSIVLDDYWHRGKYKNKQMIILEDHVSIEDRRDNNE